VVDTRAIAVLRNVFTGVCAHAQATRVEMDGEDDDACLLIHDSFAVGAILSELKEGACRAFWSKQASARLQ